MAEIKPEIRSLGSHPVPQPENTLATSCTSNVCTRGAAPAGSGAPAGPAPRFLKPMEKIPLNQMAGGQALRCFHANYIFHFILRDAGENAFLAHSPSWF